MEFIDSYLREFIVNSLAQESAEPPTRLVQEAVRAHGDTGFRENLLQAFGRLPFTNLAAIRTIISHDMRADTVDLPERGALLQDWLVNCREISDSAGLLFCEEQHVFFREMCVSELALADNRTLRLDEVMFHRARSIACSMLCIVHAELIPILRQGLAGFELTCDVALALALLDDAEDAEEDARAQSPTLFTCCSTELACAHALRMLGALEAKANSSLIESLVRLLGLLELRPLVLMATVKTLELQGKLPPSPGFDFVGTLSAGFKVNVPK